ncbi:hypothetical protein IG631_09354 [Alternaria alternata]|nr:hypothetical protein IG631_09354 [Alternaria alternata]
MRGAVPFTGESAVSQGCFTLVLAVWWRREIWYSDRLSRGTLAPRLLPASSRLINQPYFLSPHTTAIASHFDAIHPRLGRCLPPRPFRSLIVLHAGHTTSP